jgi:hypothetical protein
MLVATRCAIENQIRGLLKTFGLVLGKACRRRFEIRLRELLAAEPRLGRLVAPLLEVRRSLIEQIRTYDLCLIAIARHDTVAWSASPRCTIPQFMETMLFAMRGLLIHSCLGCLGARLFLIRPLVKVRQASLSHASWPSRAADLPRWLRPYNLEPPMLVSLANHPPPGSRRTPEQPARESQLAGPARTAPATY